MQKHMLFLGDSFTWGEGLELYCNTPKWIAERENDNNDWLSLLKKQDEDGIRFREQNRFPALVAKHFNKTALVGKENGGCLAAYVRVGQKFLFNPSFNIDTIVVQFSAFTREPLHGSFTCLCDFCVNTGYFRAYESMYAIIKKLIDNEDMSEPEQETLDMFEYRIGLKATDIKFLDKFIEQRNNWYQQLLNNFYFNHVFNWMANNKRKFYFMDSWVQDSSAAIDEFMAGGSLKPKHRIHLIGKDNKLYSKWIDWETTFEHKRIQDEFKNCGNGHPTLEQHQYLAKSVIRHIENDFFI